MKINEFIHTPNETSEGDYNLITALELIRNRYKEQNKTPKVSTQSLINMVVNTDKTFNYDALVAASENNPAIKNLIKSYNKDQVTLRTDDPSNVTTTITPDEDGDITQNPVDDVDSMAKRAAKKRDADLF